MYVYLVILLCEWQLLEGLTCDKSSLSLSLWPNDIPLDTSTLDLSNNLLTTVNADILTPLTSLQDINLDFNGLSDLSNLTVVSSSLAVLHISENTGIGPLLDSNTFTGFTGVLQLYMKRVGFVGSTFPRHVLEPMGPTLIYLLFSYNEVDNISCSELEPFTALKTLILYDAKVKYVGNLTCLADTLTLLNLYSNQITSLAYDIFDGFLLRSVSFDGVPVFPNLTDSADSLEFINADSVAYVPADHFTRLTKLERLVMRYCSHNYPYSIPDIRRSNSTLTILDLHDTYITTADQPLLCELTGIQFSI